jgi:hypothetical protein
MTALNGFIAGANAETADTVSLWSGESFRTLYLADTSEAGAAWRQVDATALSGTGTENGLTFSPFRAVMVQKRRADPDYIVPSAL